MEGAAADDQLMILPFCALPNRHLTLSLCVNGKQFAFFRKGNPQLVPCSLFYTSSNEEMIRDINPLHPLQKKSPSAFFCFISENHSWISRPGFKTSFSN
ncbi:hypothetical protein TNIN_104311 [Trichonephila inaurata madagascariensis]|uniref:Uncharacterized protein n=1 Tax=Trichonephila inaurata madagascariensis TaxID=2747483 RepID=A0A8X6WRJ7_9ARAC|nr:hypothetical protein TNIN_104311 [Trichonephila inaurata madagascariensis]